ncbi:WARS2 (predicted) [Pycnogonum litorale]
MQFYISFCFRATTVPVGDDQLQHIQLAQQLAKSFNNKFGYCFPIPKAVIGEDLSSIPRLKSLRDVTRKMSKSDPDSKSRIDVTDTPDLVRSKLKKALTDFTSEVSYDPASRPAVSNLIALHSQFSGLSTQQICKESHGLETAEYKMVVADVLIEFLKPIQTRINELLDDRQHLCSLLRKGSTEAREISTKTLTEVKNKMGLN